MPKNCDGEEVLVCIFNRTPGDSEVIYNVEKHTLENAYLNIRKYLFSNQTILFCE